VPLTPLERPDTGPRARLDARIWPVVLLATIAACGLWIAHRAAALERFFTGTHNAFVVLFTFVCALFIWQVWLAWRQRRGYDVPPESREYIAGLNVCVNVPCYNEDPALLHRALGAIFSQTRPADHVEVVDDGSTVDYSAVRAYWESNAPRGTGFTWRRTENRGKRHAQAETFMRLPADIFVTVDSDTVLDPHAIENGLAPFADPGVTAVGGVVLGLNKRHGLLTRVEDLVFTSMQLTMRSAYSQLGSVVVNSGALAFYRADIVRENSVGYLAETIMGRPVNFSDDSLLTLYAATRGRTVQQVTAVAFTHWPETVSHHVRQQVRWMRGSALRTLWRARYLPLDRPAFWLNAVGLAQFIAITVALVYLVANPQLVASGGLLGTGVMIGLAYVAMLRSLLMARSDETPMQRAATFALAPLGMLWLVLPARALRLYGMATFARTQWGTRTVVEGGRAREAAADQVSMG
jgi:hyaluronan synthase